MPWNACAMFQDEILPASTIPADTQIFDLFCPPQLWSNCETPAGTIQEHKLNTYGGRKDFLDACV